MFYDCVVEIFGEKCNEIIYIFVIVGIVKDDFVIYNVSIMLYI